MCYEFKVQGYISIVERCGGWLPGLSYCVVCGAVYIRYVSPTRVALVNFPAYQASSIALANESRWVRVDVLTVEEAAKIGRYDVALFFGPGLRLNGDQAADIEAAGS